MSKSASRKTISHVPKPKPKPRLKPEPKPKAKAAKRKYNPAKNWVRSRRKVGERKVRL